MIYSILYLVGINIAGFWFCGHDKKMAEQNEWRISEKFLLLICILGGCFGFYAGMLKFRHKTQKKLFQFGIPMLCILWAALLVMAFLRGGF